MTRKWALTTLILLGASPAEALPDWVHGTLQGEEAAYRLEPPDACPETQRRACSEHFVREGGRLQLEVSPRGDWWGLFGKGDLVYDGVERSVAFDLRESYLDLRSQTFDLRIGRQIITWGVGDLVFITDVFPKDRTALMTGLPLEYVKRGSDAFSMTAHALGASLQLLIIPRFNPDVVPHAGGVLSYYDPMASIANRRTDEPPASVTNTQAGLRLSGSVGDWDLALSAYRGFFYCPSAAVEPGRQLQFFFPRLAVYGGTAQGAVWGGVLSLEGGYYDSLDDRSGRLPAIENSSLKALVGYQREIVPDLLASVQYYVQRMQHYEDYLSTQPTGLPRHPHARQLLTARLTQALLNQTLKLGAYLQVSPAEGDYYLNTEASYSVLDPLTLNVGLNAYGGPSTTDLGQFKTNSNVYLVMRFGF